MRAGLAATYMLARQQYIEAKDILVDGAHNVDSLQFLHETLERKFCRTGEDSARLGNEQQGCILSRQDCHGRTGPGDRERDGLRTLHEGGKAGRIGLRAASVVGVIPNVGEALAAARKLAKESGAMIVIAGSLYLAGEVLDLLKAEEDA